MSKLSSRRFQCTTFPASLENRVRNFPSLVIGEDKFGGDNGREFAGEKFTDCCLEDYKTVVYKYWVSVPILNSALLV
jgi:hypothetical protein